MNTLTAQFASQIEISRIISQLFDRRWLIGMITLGFACGGIFYAIVATPIYRGDALVQVERRSSVSPLGDLANVMGDSMAGYSESSTAAEVQILQSRMVLGQVVDRIELDNVIIPKELPLVGGAIRRQQLSRPEFVDRDIHLGGWLPEKIRLPSIIPTDTLPEVFKAGIELPEFLQSPFTPPGFDLARTAVWHGETLTLGLLEVADHLRNQPLVVTALGEGRYSLTRIYKGRARLLGEGKVGRVERFLNDEVKLRIATLEAVPGAQFTLIKRSRSAAITSLAKRLRVNELGQDSPLGASASTGMLRLMLTGDDRAEIRRSLNAVIETFLTQNVERKSAEADQSLAFLKEQAPELRNHLAAAEERLNEYRMAQQSVDLSAEAQGAIQQFIALDSQLSELEFEEAVLVQRYTSSHPTYQALIHQRQILLDERAELEARVSELPGAQQEIISRTRDVEATQVIYVDVLNKIQELEIARAGMVGNVRIIDDALVGVLPVEPRKSFLVILATVLGAMAAVGFVLTRALFKRGIETPEQIEDTGLPVYASIPRANAQKKLNKRVRHRNEHHYRNVFSEILVEVEPTDISIEALRNLRTSLHFTMLDSQDNRLMITGPSPGVGKSFITVNLAAVCALSNQRVLVIDADMRRGQLHHAFGTHAQGGLSELLAGRLSDEQAIRHSRVRGLDYISRGLAPPNPSELLLGASLKPFLARVSERYDLVIIDSPPVLTVTDPAVLGAQCGTTLMVAMFETTTSRELNIAKRRLENAGVTLQGAILNAMERRAAVSYGDGDYQYAY
ncbi:polysaccharide biosynthesis tyrosine autokinase [Halomonas sp. KAO]|uniref:polysaccharide biosynthesis tyrosine autokinase n=1 Tax=Halomonas sp. KAO TaxID=2783858 RepID=UPI00189E7EBE|nr:polysaccharide biosynthesis tyrosine autokinase [Halomonas sp. KAO]MBF7053208.1 polysaccharide biosynthesis tyrosine autokinase [Halomonas sp. KAO]